MNVDRIRTEHHVSALVAVDSFPLIAQRIQRLAPVGRRFAVAHRYATYLHRAPDVYPALTVAQVRVNESTNSLWVECEPDFGFGIGIRDVWLAATEADAWKYYHAGRHEAESFSERRRDLTYVELTGGRDGDALSGNDRILIHTYNGDGVCDERAIAFEAALAHYREAK